MTDIRKKLAENIKKERTKRRLSRAKLAEVIGVNSPSTIGNWEAGISSPGCEKLCRLAELFDTSVDELFGRKRASSAETVPFAASSELSERERQFLDRYSCCDEIGQETIENCIEFQYKRCITSHLKDRPGKSKNTTGIQKVFLEEGVDPQYAEFVEKLPALRILKTGSKKSYMDITQHLWDLGYGGEIRLEYVMDIFGVGRNERVPCARLYRHIENYLRGNYWIGSM